MPLSKSLVTNLECDRNMVEPLECRGPHWKEVKSREAHPLRAILGFPLFLPFLCFLVTLRWAALLCLCSSLHHRLKSSATHQPGADPTKLNQKKPLKPVSSMFLSQQWKFWHNSNLESLISVSPPLSVQSSYLDNCMFPRRRMTEHKDTRNSTSSRGNTMCTNNYF